MNVILFSIIIVGGLIVGLFAYKSMKRKFAAEESEDKPAIYLSRKGSIVFYIFIALLFIFLLVMYIMYKQQ
ncbi:MAG: hypothetical protein LBL74_04335 [Bacteroidales bacterium]|jgi:uncharacterized membrane protein YjgN (DUF898 family)|nr:hypothetical protein [Bacteroidales bacterium]